MKPCFRWLAVPFRTASLYTLACVAILFVYTVSAQAFQLVTTEEAALPAGTIPGAGPESRAPMRRPRVVVVSPPPGAGLMHSPVQLKLVFRAYGGTEIDPDSVMVTYVKQPAIDITQRIKPFITPTGIDITQAEVPPGQHQFWIRLMDNDGLPGTAEISFQIAK